MPRRELKYPKQVEDWLIELSREITVSAEMILIGSGGLLWHAAQKKIETPLPESSMDVDPITDSDEVARICYQAIIGSDFERTHGWHVNLMPESVLSEFPPDWKSRATTREYGLLRVIVPGVADLLKPKLKRGEPRDHAHATWVNQVSLL